MIRVLKISESFLARRQPSLLLPTLVLQQRRTLALQGDTEAAQCGGRGHCSVERLRARLQAGLTGTQVLERPY